MSENIIKLTLAAAAAADPLYQWDYGQILKLLDLPLPVAYEVHFAPSRSSATSYTVIGDTDGAAITDIGACTVHLRRWTGSRWGTWRTIATAQ